MRLFFSHSWTDSLDLLNVHEKIVSIALRLRQIGYDVWIDENCMTHDIDFSMFTGVTNCDIFLCFITSSYLESIQNSMILGTSKSNCFKEWTLACQLGKVIVPIFLENVISYWKSTVLCMYTGSSFRIESFGLTSCDELVYAIYDCITNNYGTRKILRDKYDFYNTSRRNNPHGGKKSLCIPKIAIRVPKTAIRVPKTAIRV